MRIFQRLEMKSRQQSASEDLEDKESLLPDSGQQRRLKKKPQLSTWIILLATLFAAFISLCVGVLLGRASSGDVGDLCLKRVSQDSPLLEDIDISFKTIRFNGSFLHENVFRQSAGPEVDAAWEALGVNYRSVAIPVSRAGRAGLRSDQVKINPKYGGGYPANVEGLHQLHCLNLLRQALWYNFDYYEALGNGAFKNERDILQKHVSHCLDIIRQQLMCTVDIGVLGQVWWNPSFPTAFVDFNTRHKCRDFDTIRRWAEARQLPENPPPDFLQPPQPGDTVYREIP